MPGELSTAVETLYRELGGDLSGEAFEGFQGMTLIGQMEVCVALGKTRPTPTGGDQRDHPYHHGGNTFWLEGSSGRMQLKGIDDTGREWSILWVDSSGDVCPDSGLSTGSSLSNTFKIDEERERVTFDLD